MKCFICGSNRLFQFLSLGHQPPSDAFLSPHQLLEPEITYPLDLFVCEDCYLVQLGYVVDPDILFREYAYTTSSNNSLKVNFKNLVDLVVKRFKLGNADLAIDIGSNDGTLLGNYLPYGVNILGIDPSSVAATAKKNGIPTIVDFFNERVAQEARNQYGSAKVITATNVFAHVADLQSFVRGVQSLLVEDGVFISESHSLFDLITKLQYDSFYHEHLRCYSLKPLRTLFHNIGMELFDAEEITTHGGSLRVYAATKGVYPVADSVRELIKQEEAAGLYDKGSFIRFAGQVKKNKLMLNKLVVDLKNGGNRIVGIGAPAKGNTLLNYCKLDPDLIDYLAERSELKIGTFAPGSHIPVVSEQRVFDEQPEYGLLLSWNLADELMEKLRKNGFRGKFIIPNPTPKVV